MGFFYLKVAATQITEHLAGAASTARASSRGGTGWPREGVVGLAEVEVIAVELAEVAVVQSDGTYSRRGYG